MNSKIIIDNNGKEHIATLVEYDPVNKTIPENTIDEVRSGSFSFMLQEIGSKGWHDKLRNNSNI